MTPPDPPTFTPLKRLPLHVGGDTQGDIAGRCRAVAEATGALGLTNPLGLYEELCAFLAQSTRIRVVPLENLRDAPPPEKISIGLRHDVDADIAQAVDCAQVLQRYELPGSFFLLHNSHYWGRVEADRILRHAGMLHFVDRIRRTGSEIGLHTDALGFIFDHGIDGVAVLCADLMWLRASGAVVRGTAAHNSAAVYGAENFEMFTGLSLAGRATVTHAGKTVELARLDMQALGLAYEANHPLPRAAVDPERLAAIAAPPPDALRDPAWQRLYFLDHPVFARGYDYDAWLIGRDRWLLAGAGEIEDQLSQAEFLYRLERLPPGARVAVTVHPIYVGEPANETESPAGKLILSRQF